MRNLWENFQMLQLQVQAIRFICMAMVSRWLIWEHWNNIERDKLYMQIQHCCPLSKTLCHFRAVVLWRFVSSHAIPAIGFSIVIWKFTCTRECMLYSKLETKQIWFHHRPVLLRVAITSYQFWTAKFVPIILLAILPFFFQKKTFKKKNKKENILFFCQYHFETALFLQLQFPWKIYRTFIW